MIRLTDGLTRREERGGKENRLVGFEAHLLLSLGHFPFLSLGLAGSLSTAAQRVHHDGHHVLVHTQDADQVRVLEEDVVVDERPVRGR